MDVPRIRNTYGPPVHIETNGYILRSLTENDVNDRFVQWLNDEDMRVGLNLPNLNFTIQNLKHFITSFNNLNNYIIGIFDRVDSLLIGFYTVDVDLNHRVGNITTGLGERKYQGKGVLWANIDALLDHFYLYRGVEKFSARVLSRNFKMLFNFRGDPRFKFEARLIRECRAEDGNRLDVLVFSSHKDV